jgi:hypothetical protein
LVAGCIGVGPAKELQMGFYLVAQFVPQKPNWVCALHA